MPNYSSADNGGSLSIEIGFDDPSEIDKIIEDLKQIENKLSPAIYTGILKEAEKYFIQINSDDDAAKPPAPQKEANGVRVYLPPSDAPPQKVQPQGTRQAGIGLTGCQNILAQYMDTVGFRQSKYGFSKKVGDAYWNIGFQKETDMVYGNIALSDGTKVKERDVGFPNTFHDILNKAQDMLNDYKLKG